MYRGLAIVAAGAGLGVIAIWWERWRRRQLIDSRSNLSDHEIFAHFYSESGIPEPLLIKAWHEVADQLHVDPAKLRPSDKIEHMRKAPIAIESDVDALESRVLALSQKSGKLPGTLLDVDSVVKFIANAEEKRL